MMKIIYKERRNGKTFELIKRAHQLGCEGKKAYIICQHRKASFEIQDNAERLGLKIHLPITYHDFRNHNYYGKNITCFLIDDADAFLENLSPTVQIDTITLTKED